MNFDINASVSFITVFLQGLISFFSPCVLPLLPLYLVYLSGNAAEAAGEESEGSPADAIGREGRMADETGNGATAATDSGVRDSYASNSGTGHRRPSGRRTRTLVNTLFFVFGIAGAFFLLGLSATALGHFFSDRQVLFARIGGVIVILFGLYQLGWLGNSRLLDSEKRIPFRFDRLAMHPLTALLMGFAFSFAWTPCVGPTLTSVLLMTASAKTQAKGLLLIAVYTLGFSLPFLAAALFSDKITDLYQRHRGVLRYTAKIGGVLLICMGLMMYTGSMNSITGYLSKFGAKPAVSQGQEAQNGTGNAENSSSESQDTGSGDQNGSSGSQNDSQGGKNSSSNDRKSPPTLDFELKDQYGETWTLESFKGKIVFFNFWATWCPPCRQEMPHIQELYEEYSADPDSDVLMVGVAGPNIGSEGDADSIAKFLKDNGYTFPVLMDEGGALLGGYGISAFPTTFMIDKAGLVYGYVSGALTKEIMMDIIDQTRENGTEP